MIVPGSNLLKMAQTVIRAQTVQYRAFVSRLPNSVGLIETTFAAAVPVKGNFQPVPRTMYEHLGLDYTKNYAMLYSTELMQDVTRDRTGDQFDFGGVVWQIESANNWHAVDGWNGLLAIEVGKV